MLNNKEQDQRIRENAKGIEQERLDKMTELMKNRKEIEIPVHPTFEESPDEWYDLLTKLFDVVCWGASETVDDFHFMHYKRTTLKVIVECPFCKQLFYMTKYNILDWNIEKPKICPRCQFPSKIFWA